MSGSGNKGSGRGGDLEADRDAFRKAFADVKPLSRKSPKRVVTTPEAKPASIPSRRDEPRDPLLVERESTGIVLGRRRATHASIIDALEDPKLEVEAECDLHGLTAQEAKREVHRFVRECQHKGIRWVLVIAGKGRHSPGGQGTLKEEMVDALSTGASARFVLAFRTAPRGLGGTGAFVVRLVDRL